MVEALNIHSIYLATEGEGYFIGTPQIFVRFQGCAVGCINCDSRETWSFASQHRTTIEKCIQNIQQITEQTGIRRVSITGGDPLHPKNRAYLPELIDILRSKSYFINLEAAGNIIDHTIFNMLDYISFDVKTPSTGVLTPENHIQDISQKYLHKIQFKSVVSDKKDFDFLINLQEKIKTPLPEWFITPSYLNNEAFPQERFIKIIQLNQNNGGKFRVVGQQHKWIFGPATKDV